MARNLVAASSQYLELAATVVTAMPLSISCWFRPSTTTAAYNLVVVGANTGSGYFGLLANITGTSAAIAAEQNGTVDAITSTLYTAGQWSHACAVFTSTTLRAAYLNGGGKATNTTQETITTFSQVNIGAYHSGASVFSPLDGQIAEVAIWNVDLSDPEVAALAGRTGDSLYKLPSRIRPANLVAYWPLFGEITPEYNCSGNGTSRNITTVNGPTVVPHPDFLLPPRRRPVSFAVAVTPSTNPATMLMSL